MITDYDGRRVPMILFLGLLVAMGLAVDSSLRSESRRRRSASVAGSQATPPGAPGGVPAIGDVVAAQREAARVAERARTLYLAWDQQQRSNRRAT